MPNGIHCLFGLALLNKANNCIRYHDGENDPRIDPMAEQCGNRGADEQNVDKNVVKVKQESRDDISFGSLGKAVGAMGGPPLLCFGMGQARRG